MTDTDIFSIDFIEELERLREEQRPKEYRPQLQLPIPEYDMALEPEEKPITSTVIVIEF